MRLLRKSNELLKELQTQTSDWGNQKAKRQKTIDAVRGEIGNGAPTFRNTYWGMNVTEVIAKEGQPTSRSKDGRSETIGYAGLSVGGLSAIAVFRFIDGVLVSGGYFINEEHANRTLHVDDFRKLTSLLTRKYGEPAFDRTVWKNRLFEDDRDQWGTAVAAGQLEFVASWSDERTEIMNYLTGDNFKIAHTLHYTSNALKFLQDEESVQDDLDGL